MSSTPRAPGGSELGPEWDVAWVEGPRTRAKQLEMLAIDLDFSEQWVETMRRLVERNLGDQEFTIERMAKLHEWERARKRAQKNLHYKYDPHRRKKRLVERDVARQLKTSAVTLEARMAEVRAKLESRRAELPTSSKQSRELVRTRPRPPKTRDSVEHPGWANFHPNTKEMISTDLRTISDVSKTTDARITEAYEEAGYPPDAIAYYL